MPCRDASCRRLFISAAVVFFMATVDWASFSRITLPLASSTRIKVRGAVYTPSLTKVAKPAAISSVVTPFSKPPSAMLPTCWESV